MKKNLTYFFAAIFCFTVENTAAQNLFGEIAGTVQDETGLPVPGVAVTYTRGGNLQGTNTDENGRYRLKPLDAGLYNIAFSFIGFRKDTVKQVNVSAGQITLLNHQLRSDTLPAVEIIYHRGLFDVDETSTGHTFSQEEIEYSITTNPVDIAANTAGVYQKDSGSEINVRGSRSDATQYYVDGIKMIGSFFIPKSAIKEISVITGGLPAMFGDATGGVVVITTKSYWDR